MSWFESALGEYILEHELAWFDVTCTDIFGFNAMQIGQCHIDFLRANRMPFRFTSSVSDGLMHARPEALPIQSESIDLIALPHALEFSPAPQQLMREVERVLRPEGRLLLTGFNPLSLLGLRRLLGSRHGYPWHGRFLHLTRIKDWLSLMGFELLSGRMICYAPPVNRAKCLRRFRFMEAAGDRWWALGGGVYMLHAVKRVHGMRLITPRWEESWLPNGLVARPGVESSRKYHG